MKKDNNSKTAAIGNLRQTAILAMIAACLCGGQIAYAEPLEVTDHPAPAIGGAVSHGIAQRLAPAIGTVDETDTPQQAGIAETVYTVPDGYYEPLESATDSADAITPDQPTQAAYNPMYGENGPTRQMPGYHDGRKETYYSSNVLHHYRTDEWTVDADGFYRTDEGYYVVGVTYGDYELGDTFEGGKGTCYVADFGWTDEPITDYYTNW